MGIAALAILYGIYKFSPIISQSLESEGFKLIQNAQNKEEIYKRMLVRYKDDINKDIKLDEFLTSKEQKWVALSFWCDVETSGKKFFVSLDNHKKYCAIGVVDYLVDGKKLEGIDEGEDGMYVNSDDMFKDREIFLKYQELFKKHRIKWKDLSEQEINKAWINWCKVQKYLEKKELSKKVILNFCLNQRMREMISL
ncbi:hypothetical protein A6V39_05430 [Candidatus Mycoplasma haematobovis]|uniref:Uncharacterized protein n=1 Tax=Candidatus Mycoplasma haematobovis TaxID=432608 RepID=A0A1A9QCQ5_9MOLU|nr:hypothetical protein [Candidatus Mycoplasma haematobovis]OAL09735.1 hypothetical protein A6V39_05430 [Candidatus Mycoplasma haematobovis]